MAKKINADEKAALAAVLDSGVLDGETTEGAPNEKQQEWRDAWNASVQRRAAKRN